MDQVSVHIEHTINMGLFESIRPAITVTLDVKPDSDIGTTYNQAKETARAMFMQAAAEEFGRVVERRDLQKAPKPSPWDPVPGLLEWFTVSSK